MTHPEYGWSRPLYTLFKRVHRDTLLQKMVQTKMYKLGVSFLSGTVSMCVLSLLLSVSLIVLLNPSIMFSALIGLNMGMLVTFGGQFILNQLKNLEEGISFTSFERRQEVEATLRLLEQAGEFAHTEVFKNALKDTMTYLKDPTTSYALWKQVNAYLRAINTEHNHWEAANHQQSEIDVAIEQLSNKLHPPPSSSERVIKL